MKAEVKNDLKGGSCSEERKIESEKRNDIQDQNQNMFDDVEEEMKQLESSILIVDDNVYSLIATVSLLQ